MTMTKKDYELIAGSVADCITHEQTRHERLLHNESVAHQQTLAAIKSVASQMSIKFRLANPSFDIGRFMRACGVEEIPEPQPEGDSFR
jgi:hypothetical protein